MGRIITDSRGLLEQPKDPFWDASATRRELQNFAQIFSDNDEALTMRADTGHIVLNLICEKLGITKQEIDAYVQVKLAQLKAAKEAAAKQAEQATNGPNQ